jgi:hypothetical protein
MTRLTLVVLVASLSLMAALPASAQWKWRDKNGQTQYSDLPPPGGVTEQDILQRPSGSANARVTPRPTVVSASAAETSASAPVLSPKSTEPELEAKRKKAEQEAADKKKAEAVKQDAVRADNCTRAKDYMRTIDSGVRLSSRNAKGELEVLDDTGRAAETKRIREVMSSECK